MAGNKTHDQQLRIIEGRENTKNADPDFDARQDLDRSPEQREALRRGQDLPDKSDNLSDPDDRSIIRGENQESAHHKKRAD